MSLVFHDEADTGRQAVQPFNRLPVERDDVAAKLREWIRARGLARFQRFQLGFQITPLPSLHAPMRQACICKRLKSALAGGVRFQRGVLRDEGKLGCAWIFDEVFEGRHYPASAITPS